MYGAAGVVFVVRFPDGPRVMLQKRSALAHEGGTWSCAGGALDEAEEPLAGALREASEEIGPIPERRSSCSGSTVFAPADDWSYTTFVVEVPGEFGASINFETDAIAWDTPRRGRAPPAARRVRRRLAGAARDHRSRLSVRYPVQVSQCTSGGGSGSLINAVSQSIRRTPSTSSV